MVGQGSAGRAYRPTSGSALCLAEEAYTAFPTLEPQLNFGEGEGQRDKKGRKITRGENRENGRKWESRGGRGGEEKATREGEKWMLEKLV